MEEPILYKHHLAAHASASFSLIERKLLNILLYNAFPKLSVSEEFKIDISSIIKQLGIKTRNYTQIYKSIQNIACTLIEWGILKTHTLRGELTGVTFLEMYHIKNGLITYRIPRELRAIFIEPDRYTKIRMTTVSSLKSSYGMVLYENCSSYVGLGNTGWITLNDFKRLMGISDRYAEYRDLNKRVIRAALADVNKNSEFNVNVVEFKEARKVAKLKFNIEKKLETPDSINEVPSTAEITNIGISSVIHDLLNMGIPKRKALSWIKKYDEDFIRARISYVNTYKQVRSKPALLIEAIENDYQVGAAVNPEKQQISRQEQELLYKSYKKNLILDWFDKLNTEEWQSFCDLLIMHTDHPVARFEFENRLYNKSYLEYESTLIDVLDYSYRLIMSKNPKLQHLCPPFINNWKEFLAGACQSPP
jgi:hypothetical protein